MSRVLIIDDEADIRDALREVLERAGFDVHCADNGAAGLKLLKRLPADVAVVDIIMPGIDGVETIRQIRRKHVDTRIIAMSGGGNIVPLAYRPDAINTTAYLVSARQAGADATLTKPFSRQEVLNTIRKLTGDSGPD